MPTKKNIRPAPVRAKAHKKMCRVDKETIAVAHDFLSAVERDQEVPPETAKALAEALRVAIAGKVTFSRALGLVQSQRGRPKGVGAHRDIADPWLPSRPEYTVASLLDRFAWIADGAIDQLADTGENDVRARDAHTIRQARILRFLIDEQMVRHALTLRFLIDTKINAGPSRPLMLWMADQLRIGIANPRLFPTLLGMAKTSRGRPVGRSSARLNGARLSEDERHEIALEYLALLHTRGDHGARLAIKRKYRISDGTARNIFAQDRDEIYSEMYFAVEQLLADDASNSTLDTATRHVAKMRGLSRAMVSRAHAHVRKLLRKADSSMETSAATPNVEMLPPELASFLYRKLH